LAVVSAQLAFAAIVDPLTAALAAGAGLALLLGNPSSVLLMAIGAAVGLAGFGLGIRP